MANRDKPSLVRVLVVDDEPHRREMMREHFDQKDTKVATVASGAAALSVAARERSDVELLDRHVPDMNVLERVTTLKHQHPEMEVIMLTAHGSIESAIHAMKAGAYDFLTKPFHFSELDIHLQKALEKVSLARRERQWIEHISFESPRYRMCQSGHARHAAH